MDDITKGLERAITIAHIHRNKGTIFPTSLFSPKEIKLALDVVIEAATVVFNLELERIKTQQAEKND